MPPIPHFVDVQRVSQTLPIMYIGEISPPADLPFGGEGHVFEGEGWDPD